MYSYLCYITFHLQVLANLETLEKMAGRYDFYLSKFKYLSIKPMQINISLIRYHLYHQIFHYFFQGREYSEDDLREICAAVLRGICKYLFSLC